MQMRAAASGGRAVADALAKALEDVGWNEPGDVAAEAENLLDHARAYKGVTAGGLQKDGLDFRCKTAIHQGHLELVLVIGDGANAAKDRRCSLTAREVDHETVKCGDGNIVERRRCFCQHLHALFHGEERILHRIDEDGDGELTEDARTTRDEIKVAVCRRIKGA